jgi:hypothetical protein
VDDEEDAVAGEEVGQDGRGAFAFDDGVEWSRRRFRGG